MSHEDNVQRSLGRIEQQLLDLNHAILGNGGPGLQQRVGDLEKAAAAKQGAVKLATTVAGVVGATKLYEWVSHFVAYVKGSH